MWLGRLKIVVAGAIKNLPACNNRHKTAKPLQTRPNLLTGAFKTFFSNACVLLSSCQQARGRLSHRCQCTAAGWRASAIGGCR